MIAESQSKAPERVGPYSIHHEIGSGGMATVHLGRMRSPSGFSRIVAIKRMHAELTRSPEFVAMFLEEARLVARIQHPNVVAALDWIANEDCAFLVMEYVHGVSLDQALRSTTEAGRRIPLAITSAVLIGTLMGLHAAHEAVDESGKNLGIVHRDVSPHNILVGVDGLARVLDFGIAKTAERVQHTRTGEVKGKLAYMSPEQLFHDRTGREADLYSVGVILWEMVVGRRLFATETQGQMLMRIANSRLDSPRSVRPDVSPEVAALTMKALSRRPEDRFRTALEFATALEVCVPPASQRVVGEWLATAGREGLLRRSALKLQVEGAAPVRVCDASAGELPGGEGTSGSRMKESSSDSTSKTLAFQRPAPSRRPLRNQVALGGLLILGGAVFGKALPWRVQGVRSVESGARGAATSTASAGPQDSAPSASAKSSGPQSGGIAETASRTPDSGAKPGESEAPGPGSDPTHPAHVERGPSGRADPSRSDARARPVPVRVVPPRSPAPAHTSELDSIGGRE